MKLLRTRTELCFLTLFRFSFIEPVGLQPLLNFSMWLLGVHIRSVELKILVECWSLIGHVRKTQNYSWATAYIEIKPGIEIGPSSLPKKLQKQLYVYTFHKVDKKTASKPLLRSNNQVLISQHVRQQEIKCVPRRWNHEKPIWWGQIWQRKLMTSRLRWHSIVVENAFNWAQSRWRQASAAKTSRLKSAWY